MWLNSLFKYPNLTLHIKWEILVFEEVKFAGTLQKKTGNHLENSHDQRPFMTTIVTSDSLVT